MLAELPVELIEQIINSLQLDDLKNVNISCRRLRLIVMRKLWSNLEFSIQDAGKKLGPNKTGWQNKSDHLFDHVNRGLFIKINKKNIYQFVSYLKAGKLREQLSYVKYLNFDLSVQGDYVEKKKLNWFKHTVTNKEFEKCVGADTFCGVSSIRLCANHKTPLDTLRITASIVSNLYNARVYLSLTGGMSSDMGLSSMLNVCDMDYAFNSVSELLQIKTLPSKLVFLELRVTTPISIDASFLRSTLKKLKHLRVLSLFNISIQNVDSICWLPSGVKILTMSVSESNFLQGRMGDLIKLKGLEKLVVGYGYGSVNRLLPINLSTLELNGGPYNGISERWSCRLLQENQNLELLSLQRPSVNILKALSISNVKVLEISLYRLDDSVWDALELLSEMSNLESLTMVYHACAAQRVEFEKYIPPSLKSLTITHMNSVVASLFEKRYKGIYTKYCYKGAGINEYVVYSDSINNI